MLRYQMRLCIPGVDGLRDQIIEEAHRSCYLIHHGVDKNVPSPKENILVRRSKKGHSGICC